MTHSPEVEKLARTLKSSRIAVSESEAYRMAEEMLSIGKKVQADFKERDEKIYGQSKQDNEMQTAQKMMEKISQNMGSGKSGRLDIEQLDLGKPLKQLLEEQEEPLEEDEDDAVLIKDENSPSHVPEPALLSTRMEVTVDEPAPIQIAQSEILDEEPRTIISATAEEIPEHFGRQVDEPEKIQINVADEDLFDDDEDDDKDTEEESIGEEVVVQGEEAKKSEEVEVKEIYF